MVDEREITDLTVVHDAPMVLRDPAHEIAAATIAAKELQKVIDASPDKVMIRGKIFLRYEDWQTVGQFYGYSVQTDSAEPVEVEGIKGAKAKAILLDRQGNLAGGAEAYCMRDEPKWERSPWFQLASMAQTRAGAKALRNRLAWVAVLAGYSGTPAEEMDGSEAQYAPRTEAKADVPTCPDCDGQMWDNRETKKGRQPDFKCKDKGCDKAIWLEDAAGRLTPKEAAIGKLMAQAEKLLPPDSKKLAFLRGISDPDELGKKVQILVDLANKKSKLTGDAERQKLIDEVKLAFAGSAQDEGEYLIEKWNGAELTEMSVEQLQQIRDDLEVPF